MDVINHRLDDWFTPLQTQPARTDGVIKFTFNHRIHLFSLPAWPEQSVQARSCYQIGSGFPFRRKQLSMMAHWWDNVQRAEFLGIKASSRHHHPSTWFRYACQIGHNLVSRHSNTPHRYWVRNQTAKRGCTDFLSQPRKRL